MPVRITASALAMLTIFSLFGCGGGGGSGAPPAHVRGRVMLFDPAQNGGQPSAVASATVSIGGASIVTDSSGVFDFLSVGSDSTTLTVSATGIKALSQPLPALTPSGPPQNATNDLGDVFVVDTAGAYTAVADGFVIRADTKAAIAGAKVLVSGQVAISASNGSFTISNLPAGLGGDQFNVGKITKDQFEDKLLQFVPVLGASPPSNNLGNLEMSPPVQGIPGGPVDITGKISLQGLANLSGTTVELRRKSDNSLLGSELTAGVGKFGYWVIAGQYKIVAVHTGFTTKSQDVTVGSPAIVQTINLTLVP